MPPATVSGLTTIDDDSSSAPSVVLAPGRDELTQTALNLARNPGGIVLPGPPGTPACGIAFAYSALAVDHAEAARSAAERIRARTAAGKRI